MLQSVVERAFVAILSVLKRLPNYLPTDKFSGGSAEPGGWNISGSALYLSISIPTHIHSFGYFNAAD